MALDVAPPRTLVMGIGNTLLSDDGVGVHVVRALERGGAAGETVSFRDGGTIGLALLNELDDFDALIVIDAMELGAAPGTVKSFQGQDMDAQLGGKKRTAHEVALADLIMAAALTDCVPRRRALVAVQPDSTHWGLAPTESIRAAIPEACRTVMALMEEWNVAQ